jgi:polysaccharide biosynthesis/export protein
MLLVCTVCAAQTPPPPAPVPAAAAPTPVFRPTQVEQQQQQQEQSRTGSAQNPQQPSPVYTIGKEYLIGPNDLLDVEVLNLENAKRTVRVNAAGLITLPLVGPIPLVGLTQQQAESKIAALYGEKYLQDPQVSVFIREFTTERITVDGAVVKPGIYPLVGQMTLLRVIALAGGFGKIAKRSQVMLFRQENGARQVATFDVEKIQAGEQPDPPIRGDDLIVVQRDATRAVFTDSILRDIVDVVNPFNYIPN